MSETWTKVFESEEFIRAEIARETLDQQNIAAVIVDKRDSSYPIFGKYEIHVLSQDVPMAQNILFNAATTSTLN